MCERKREGEKRVMYDDVCMCVASLSKCTMRANPIPHQNDANRKSERVSVCVCVVQSVVFDLRVLCFDICVCVYV